MKVVGKRNYSPNGALEVDSDYLLNGCSAKTIVLVRLTQPMGPEKKSLNFIFPTKYGIPKSSKG